LSMVASPRHAMVDFRLPVGKAHRSEGAASGSRGKGELVLLKHGGQRIAADVVGCVAEVGEQARIPDLILISRRKEAGEKLPLVR